jgi:hypothetical protein
VFLKYSFSESFDKPMCVEKRVEIFLIKAENAVNNGVMNKFFNENQENFRVFDLCIRFIKGFS